MTWFWPRRDHILAAAAIGLTGLAIWPWLAPLTAPSLSAEGAQTAAPPLAITNLPPLMIFAAVFERPLFSSSRRPPRDEKAPVLDSAVAARYRLLGVVTAGETRRALLADGARRFELAEGAAFDGWRVLRIEQDRLLLSSPNGKIELRVQRAGERASGPEQKAR